jgi:Tfp pilus assembly protein PilF
MAVGVTISTEELRTLLETGFLLRERGELQKAREVFEAVVALRPDVEIGHIGLAQVLHCMDDAGAEKAFRKAVEMNPGSAHARSQLGEYLHTRGKKADALKELNRAIELDPSGPFGESARAIKSLVDEGVEYTYALPKG